MLLHRWATLRWPGVMFWGKLSRISVHVGGKVRLLSLGVEFLINQRWNVRFCSEPGVQRKVVHPGALKSVWEDFLPSEEGNPPENIRWSYLEFLGMERVRFKGLRTVFNKSAISSFTMKTQLSGNTTRERFCSFISCDQFLSLLHIRENDFLCSDDFYTLQYFNMGFKLESNM